MKNTFYLFQGHSGRKRGRRLPRGAGRLTQDSQEVQPQAAQPVQPPDQGLRQRHPTPLLRHLR